MNLLPVRPINGRTALASRCLRSPLFDEPTLVNRCRKSCEGRRDSIAAREEGGGAEDGEEVCALLQSSPVQPEK